MDNMVTWWFYCGLSLVVLMSHPVAGVMGGGPAAVPQLDAAVVFVQRHGRSARLEGTRDDSLGYYSFLGIRYAEPPVGMRRFQRPIPRRLAGEVTAVRTCSPCPQQDPRAPSRVIGQEDCLCINVYAPKMPGDEKGSPVVFFIHGGNYMSGSSSYYGGQHLTQKDTILVTAQYRLSSLGFLSTGQRDAAGNAGLFDLRSAFEWVHDYIEFFGGDPTRVVVMGQGSGGSAASLLALSSEGRGARGVAALSGAPLAPGAVRTDPARHAEALADATGCPRNPAERLVACLRKMSIEKIVQADSKILMDIVDTEKFLEEISGKMGAGARVEGEEDKRGLPPLVSETPASSLERRTQTCTLLTGVTSAETSRAIFGKYSNFLKGKLSSVKDFIKTELVGGLRGLVNGVRGLVPLEKAAASLPGIPLADYYQSLFDNSLNAVDGLAQVAEATADALFNFPAYQSVSLWSKGAPAFMYSFEHVGNLTKGSHFLPGVPLADSSGSEEETKERAAIGPAHGDELAYIFEPLDEEGQSTNVKISAADARARASFVGLIAQFAHSLSPLETNNNTKSNLAAFSTDSESFIKIGEEITVDKNFRFCQMGLWGNMAERLTAVLCKNIIGNLIKKLPVPKLPLTVPNLPLVPDLGMGTATKTPNQPTTRRTILPARLPFRL